MRSPTWASIARAEEVVREALARTSDSTDPVHARSPLLVDRAARAQRRVASSSRSTTCARQSRCCRRPTTPSTSHGRTSSPPGITLGARDADDADQHLDEAERLLGRRPHGRRHVDITQHRARIALLRGDTSLQRQLARAALELSGQNTFERRARDARTGRRSRRGRGLHRRRSGVSARRSTSSRSPTLARRVERVPVVGEMLRENGREERALDVLDRAAELGMRAAPDERARRALTIDARGRAARAVLPRALGAARERRDAHVPRRPLHRSCFDVEGRLELARAWQTPDGTVHDPRGVGAREPSGCAGSSRSTTTTPSSCGASATTRCSAARRARSAACGRCGSSTVAQALLRAFCGQLIEAKRRAATRADDHPRALRSRPPSGCTSRRRRDDLGALAPSQLRALGLHARRGAALVRLCRSLELERLRARRPTPVVAARLERERGLGPWSVGVVCLEGLGRFERGLVGDLGLVKLLARAARPAGRGLGDGRAARAVRRVGRPRERLPARRLLARPAARAKPR